MDSCYLVPHDLFTLSFSSLDWISSLLISKLLISLSYMGFISGISSLLVAVCTELKYFTIILVIPSSLSINLPYSFFISVISGLTVNFEFTYLKNALLLCLTPLARRFSYNLFACLAFFLKRSAFLLYTWCL